MWHIDVSMLQKRLAQAIQRANLKHFVLYSLRHSCLSRWAGALDPFQLKTIAGHGSIVTTQRHIHLNKKRPAEAGLMH
jgi:integrase